MTEIYFVIGLLFLLALLCIYVNNRVDGANFMYLAGYKEGVAAGDNIINYLPKNQYVRMLTLTVLVTGLFNLLYFAWYKLSKLS